MDPALHRRSVGMALAWTPGEVIAGRYRLEALIGEGGTGQVWRAEHLILKATVALKLVRPSASASGRATTKLLREARAAAALRSPHVVQILDYGLHDEVTPYVAMELLEGETLADRLARVEGPLSAGETCRIMTQLAKALTRAHAMGVVHRDLKPENIFICADPEDDDEELAWSEYVKVLDFGIAKLDRRLAEGVSKQTHVGRLLGTPNYMSPEQAETNAVVDHRTDLWSMTLIAYECVTGHIAFDEPALGPLLVSLVAGPIPVPSAVAKVPPGFDEWFSATLRRDPEERPTSARELARTLRDVLLSRAVTLIPPPAVGSPGADKRRTPFAGMMELTTRKKRRTGTRS
jgi:serine/threonine protein kinase